MEIDLVVDLQYGSTGKGLLVGYLAETSGHDGVITCNMPNAGHTYIDRQGRKWIHKVLPNGIVSPNLRYIFIGPGAVFDPARLHAEIEQMYREGITAPVLIHPNAMILRDYHREMEQNELNSIASTMQGSMAALVEKMTRQPDALCTAEHMVDEIYHPDMNIVVLNHDEWMMHLDECDRVLAEGSQGFSLGINQRFWPYCTSRECTPYRMLSDMGLPQVRVNTWGTLRTYPIRVGNTPGGYSGDNYADQSELTWDELGQTPELTTVTQRERRVFTFSISQLQESLWHCRPDHLFLNFCNYLEPGHLGVLTDQIDRVAESYGTGIRLCGYGPEYQHVKPYVKR